MYEEFHNPKYTKSKEPYHKLDTQSLKSYMYLVKGANLVCMKGLQLANSIIATSLTLLIFLYDII
jgi:hypothetical protein